MAYLNFHLEILKEKGALFTAAEISNQPFLWKKTASFFAVSAIDINNFLQSAYREVNSIILTGAGTSAFIGLSLHGAFFKKTNILSQAVATTDIVSHPEQYFSKTQVPLIISFARSGNSPESCAALKLADKFSKKCFHLIITCSNDGALAGYQSVNPVFIFALPEESNDKSLAMTGSYSSMLLAGLLTAYINERDFCEKQLQLVIQSAENILKKYAKHIYALAEKQFQRAVFLGSGPLFGTATEAALKLQELTDGQIICKADTYLGFRHGPKAVIDENTLVMYFFSNNEYVLQYETDLVHSMKNGTAAMFQLCVSNNKIENIDIDEQINYLPADEKIAEDFLPLCSVLPAQMLGFYKSLQLGLMPDAPSVSGAISRVVQGVNIYPVKL